MRQTSITGQAFRVLTDAANGVFHRISFWTHSDDVEMKNGDNLTRAMDTKYNVDFDSSMSIRSLNDLAENMAGYFTVDDDLGTLVTDYVYLKSGYTYSYFSFMNKDGSAKGIIVTEYTRTNADPLNVYVFRKSGSGSWHAEKMTTKHDLNESQEYLEGQIGALDARKYGYKKDRVSSIISLDDIPMNTVGSVLITNEKSVGSYDETANITTYVQVGEYTFFSYLNGSNHKTILLFSNDVMDGSKLRIGGGYLCTWKQGGSWVVTRILSPSDFSTDETGLREQIVASLTGQLWPVGAIYLNLTRTNPGEFLGGTWNLITEGILTAIAGSPEQTGYHQRDLYKAVRDEDRGEHLYGVFVWQRIA